MVMDALHTGHPASNAATLSAQLLQKRAWPHGTNAFAWWYEKVNVAPRIPSQSAAEAGVVAVDVAEAAGVDDAGAYLYSVSVSWNRVWCQLSQLTILPSFILESTTKLERNLTVFDVTLLCLLLFAALRKIFGPRILKSTNVVSPTISSPLMSSPAVSNPCDLVLQYPVLQCPPSQDLVQIYRSAAYIFVENEIKKWRPLTAYFYFLFWFWSQFSVGGLITRLRAKFRWNLLLHNWIAAV